MLLLSLSSMLTGMICSSSLFRLFSHSFLPLLLRERRLEPMYAMFLHLHRTMSLICGTSSRKIASRQAISRQAISRQTLHRQIPSSQALRRNAIRSRSALVLKDRINSAAMRVSILRALTVISSCATKALEKHATKESMIRAASEMVMLLYAEYEVVGKR